jgi:type IV pilus assembly protein PilX
VKARFRSQRGAALVCALVLMLATMLVGVSICRTVFAAIVSSRAERERGIAREAAEAALRDAERDIAGADAVRAALFTEPGAASFVDGCGRGGNTRGLCRAASPPAWETQDLAEPDNPALVPYGYYTGAAMGAAMGAEKGLLTARLPVYLIERIAPPGATEAMGGFFRITAIGFGSHATTRVVLQSAYRLPKPAPPAGPGAASQEPSQEPAPGAPHEPPPQAAPPPVPLPAGRLAWREIANWPQLHAAAAE